MPSVESLITALGRQPPVDPEVERTAARLTGIPKAIPGDVFKPPSQPQPMGQTGGPDVVSLIKALGGHLKPEHWDQSAAKAALEGNFGEIIPRTLQAANRSMQDPNTALGFVGGINAYHGSPHDFAKFDLGKIGTGEGAQMYGHGLYFAEAEPVAQMYRDALTAGREPNQRGNVDLEALYSEMPQEPGTLKEAQRDFEHFKDQGFVSEADRPDFMSLMEDKFKPQGHIYQVDINAKPQEFLDWDKPFTEQPPEVRRALGVPDSAVEQYKTLTQGLNELNSHIPPNWMEDPKAYEIARKVNAQQDPLSRAQRQLVSEYPALEMQGQELHDWASGAPNSVERAPLAAKNLMQKGIKGIRYADAMSRDGSGQGTHNYVVFDDSLINILRKYGLAGPAILGAAAGSSDQ